ncbi:hypothetical protein [uncultured Chitinophaga sp.]|uniref:DUF6928 family protein n=1 Tax=uncultured Chitinophaga sp. TaxID=339340 RepID=UPI0025D4C46A|nr:hypothetical protein [uncultured Chitinophaga sp.]
MPAKRYTMGYKSSIITILAPSSPVDERTLLDQLGLTAYEYTGDTTLEDAMYPNDKSVNIGYFNNCVIICDDYQLTNSLERAGVEQPAAYEAKLSALFPGSEILTTACHSVVNYHLYALAKDGVRIRYKMISSDTPVVEFGEQLEEEVPIYANSILKDGVRLFSSEFDDEIVYEYAEDQMMEDFTFGVAARHLGVRLDTGDADELSFDVPFKKYKKAGVATGLMPKQDTTASGTPSFFRRLLRKLGL